MCVACLMFNILQIILSSDVWMGHYLLRTLQVIVYYVVDWQPHTEELIQISQIHVTCHVYNGYALGTFTYNDSNNNI